MGIILVLQEFSSTLSFGESSSFSDSTEYKDEPADLSSRDGKKLGYHRSRETSSVTRRESRESCPRCNRSRSLYARRGKRKISEKYGCCMVRARAMYCGRNRRLLLSKRASFREKLIFPDYFVCISRQSNLISGAKKNSAVTIYVMRNGLETV